MKRYGKSWLVIGGLAALGSAGATIASHDGARAERSDVPTTRARRGTLSVVVRGSGELRAARSLPLTAPAIAGALLISKITPAGTRVESGEVVVELNPAEPLRLEGDARVELALASQQLEKADLEQRIEGAQDQLTVLQARLDLRNAELDVGRNELLSAIDAQRNVLALEEARRQLAQVEQDSLSRQASNRATAALAAERLRSARARMQQAHDAIEAMRLRAPHAGIVSIEPRHDSSGGGTAPGMPPSPYRAGDVVEPGVPVAEVLEAGAMEIRVGLDEVAVAQVRAGLPVAVRVDSFPRDEFRGTVTTVASVAGGPAFMALGPRAFDVVVQLDRTDPRLRPGLTAQLAIHGAQQDNVLLIPAQALETAGVGGPMVHVRRGRTFETRPVEVTARSETLAAVRGIENGAEVALARPASVQVRP
jgi:HlyD family secretion protein